MVCAFGVLVFVFVVCAPEDDQILEGYIITWVNGESRSGDLMLAKLQSIGLGDEIHLKMLSGCPLSQQDSNQTDRKDPVQESRPIDPKLRKHFATLGHAARGMRGRSARCMP